MGPIGPRERPRRPNFSPPKPFSYERKGTPTLPRHINKNFFNKKMDIENKYFFSLV